MNLSCKIHQKYFDQIIKGQKVVDHRQFENITFTAPDGQSITMAIKDVRRCLKSEDERIRGAHADVPWVEGIDLHTIYLGEKLMDPAIASFHAFTGFRHLKGSSESSRSASTEAVPPRPAAKKYECEHCSESFESQDDIISFICKECEQFTHVPQYPPEGYGHTIEDGKIIKRKLTEEYERV